MFSEEFSDFKLNDSNETQECVTKTVQAESVKVEEELLQEKNNKEGMNEDTPKETCCTSSFPSMWQYIDTTITSTHKKKTENYEA